MSKAIDLSLRCYYKSPEFSCCHSVINTTLMKGTYIIIICLRYNNASHVAMQAKCGAIVSNRAGGITSSAAGSGLETSGAIGSDFPSLLAELTQRKHFGSVKV